ncbi:diphthine--ammonia ligase [archaeon]|jgi:diphthine-ammonia ligase|nr:diphthine--ammonia ligase [archaeon]
MKLGVLFSGGKDSAYAALLAKRAGHSLSCFLSIQSKNENSFMFHTPAIELTKKQAGLCGVPFLLRETEGRKELELMDLEELIKDAIKRYKIEGIVTGAVESVYQASRIQEICNNLGIECFNPLWQMDQWELLDKLIKEGFDIIIVGVFAYPFDDKMIGRKIDKSFLDELRVVHKKLGINPAGEGGEFESLVVNCPLFSKELSIKEIKAVGEGHSWRGEVLLG